MLTDAMLPVGPPPFQVGGPPLLVGTMGPRTVRSAAAWADGLAGFTLDLDVAMTSALYDVARAAWSEAGRPAPLLTTSFWVALAPSPSAVPEARAQVHRHLRHYMNWLPPALVDAMAPTTGFAGTAAELRDLLRRLEDIGTDEVHVIPTSSDVAFVDAGRRAGRSTSNSVSGPLPQGYNTHLVGRTLSYSERRGEGSDVVEAGVVPREVAAHPVGEVAEAAVQLGRALLGGAADRERVDHRVVDQLDHRRDSRRLGQRVELGLEVAPALDVEDRAGTPAWSRRTPAARARPAVAAASCSAVRPMATIACGWTANAAGSVRRASPSSTAGRVRSRTCRWLWNGITSSPSATSAAVRVITGPSAPSSTGGGPHSSRAGDERRRHQRVPGVLAAEVEPGAVLPGAEDRLHREHDLAHPGGRRAPRGAVPVLDVRPDLRAEPQPEPAAAHPLEVVRGVREVHRRARHRDRDVGHQVGLDPRRRGRGERQEHVVRPLEGEQPGRPGIDQLAGPDGGALGRDVELQVEEHGRKVVPRHAGAVRFGG